jgi:hypothetical protein
MRAKDKTGLRDGERVVRADGQWERCKRRATSGREAGGADQEPNIFFQKDCVSAETC